MRNEIFTLEVTQTEDMVLSVEDALYMVGCDDALIHSKGERLFITFDREASNVGSLVTSARDQVELAGMKVVCIYEGHYNGN